MRYAETNGTLRARTAPKKSTPTRATEKERAISDKMRRKAVALDRAEKRGKKAIAGLLKGQIKELREELKAETMERR